MFPRHLIFLLFILLNIGPIYGQQIVLNEIMASNSSNLSDEDGDYEDWIELYNSGSQAVNLQGYGLSDDYNNPFRWVFPSVEIPAGSYLLVWASGKDRTDPTHELHTNFSISASGEEVLLTHGDGTGLDEIPPAAIPTDISYGRKADGQDQWFFFDDPTPGSSNTTQAFEGITPKPVFSHTAGFFTEEFNLEITSTSENIQIYYTLDGSKPTTNSQLYNQTIPIGTLEGTPNNLSLIPTNNNNNPGPPYYEGWQPPAGEVFKVNVVRAVAMKNNYLPSKVKTASYLVDPQGIDRYSLPVFFINTDADNFFDPDIGIYIPGHHNNMFQRGREWERPMHLSMYESDGTLAFNGDMGVRIHGGTTRSRPRKSLRIYARNDYGDSWIDYPLFPQKQTRAYKRFLLRNSGNDWDQSVFRDGFMQYLARNMHVETQYYRPAIVFLNGEYWGIHNIRDRYDPHYIFSHYALEEEEMVVVENNSVYAYGNPDGVDHYNSMRSFMNHNDLSQSANYGHVQTLMDTKSFKDAQIANIFIMNTDWPGNNTNLWRRMTPYDPQAQPGYDGRWRWHMLDTDFGFWLDFFYVPGVDQGAAHNTLAMATDPHGSSWPNPSWSTFLLRRLLTNDTFKHDFINRFADMLNTTFKEENLIAVIDSIAAVLQPEMQEHINRWRRPVSMEEWNQTVNRIRTFALDRPGHQREHLRTYFNLEGTAQVSLEANQNGHIQINTITPDLSNGWSGIYFRGVPLPVKAIPSPGYRFSHWSGSLQGSSPSQLVTPQGDMELVAHFEQSQDFAGDALNPPAWPLANGPYAFSYWGENQPKGQFPSHMLFLQSDQSDPQLHTPMTHVYHIPLQEYHEDDIHSVGFPYRLSRRSRINGLGNQGISFINTGRNRDLGAAVLAIDTRGLEDITVEWTGGTIIPNARVYAIRLQYKIGPDGVFADVYDQNGQLVEYVRSSQQGHQQNFGPVVLPSQANDQEYVQLRWKYYYTGTHLDNEQGGRDMLRLDNIYVNALTVSSPNPQDKGLAPDRLQVYPNPAADQTFISFVLDTPTALNISLWDVMGKDRKTISHDFYSAGTHTLEVNLNSLTPGIYFIRMQSDESYDVQKIMVQ